ncbi:MAG: thioredoxin, partial [Rhodospirillaceae bacterium]|nr:thioredoxin [Rhodospirillaceae bacterium]
MEMTSVSSIPDTPGDNPVIIEGSTVGFVSDVIEASKKIPVIVDFWAPWCGPCKQLTPVLENAVTQAQGRLRLVKINVDENPELAQQMQVQSVPAVFAFFEGRAVDGFAGAVPESQIK